jgi:hypothetical protein
MSMIPVQTSVPYGNVDNSAVQARLEKSNSLAGLGLIARSEAVAPAVSWQDVLKQQTAGWGTVGQQILLNRNQPVLYASGPGGTTVYGNMGIPVPGGTQPLGGGMSTTTMLLIGGVALAAVFMIAKR